MAWDKRCSNCTYSRPDWTNPNNPDHYCANEDSDEYGNNVEYIYGCEEWSDEDE